MNVHSVPRGKVKLLTASASSVGPNGQVGLSGRQRCHVDHEPVAHIRTLHARECIVDLVHADHLAFGQDFFARAEVEQFLNHLIEWAPEATVQRS